MPAIKKKWIKASQDGDVPDEVDSEEAVGDEDRETGEGASAAADSSTVKVKKPKKRSAPTSPSLLRGLDSEVLLEKRKRFIPPAEQKLLEWIESNLEPRTEETVHLPNLYAYYTDLCQGAGSEVLDLQQFSRMVKEKCGKNIGIKETSIYKTLIKERKINKEKKKSSGIKLKEITHEAINHFGNPWSGVRVFALKQYIGSKYPALQIDLKPKLLKRTLEMGVQYNQIELVKGIGMAGYYRLPGAKPPSPTKNTEPKAAEGEEKETDESAEEGKESAAEDQAPKTTEVNGEKQEESGEENKQKKHKPKKVEKVTYSRINHANPEKLEDIFPLAITYQSAPKAVSTTKIRKYIQEKYNEIVPDNKWRKAIENGVDSGNWEYVSGSGLGGKLHLLMDDFNPGSELLEDRICAAIIACHEPKAASANQIKKYISKYHPEFKVDERPVLFRKALQRAVSKNYLAQLSGLGASGTFQLTAPFVPSPLILAGEEDSEEEADGYESDEPVYVPKGTKSRGMPKVKTMEVVRPVVSKPKKSKAPAATARSTGRKVNYTEESDHSDEEKAVKRKKSPSKSKGKKTKGKIVAASSASSDDEDVQPEYTPKKSQSRGGASTASSTRPAPPKGKQPVKQGKASRSEESEVSGDERSNSRNKTNNESAAKKSSSTPSKGNARKNVIVKNEEKVAEPRRSESKNEGSSNKKKEEPSPKRKANGKSATPAKKPKVEVSDEEDEDGLDDEPEYTPTKSRSRGGPASDSKKKPANKSKSQEAVSPSSEDNASSQQNSPVKSKPKEKVAAGKKKGKGRRK